MKSRFIFAVAATLILTNCTGVDNPSAEQDYASIAAEMENGVTRTSVTDEGYFTWSTGDQVWIHTTSGYTTGTLSSGAGSSSANFTYGSYFGEMTGKAVYPFNRNHAISGDELTVQLPATYDLGANTENTNAAMYAEVSAGKLMFNHLAGVMRFEFKNVPAGANQFRITLDKKINGVFTADLTQDYPTLSTSETTEDAEKTVTLNFDTLEEACDLKFFVPLPTGTYNSLELAIGNGTEDTWTYSNEVTNTISRKSLILMPTVTMGGTIGGDIENDGNIEGDIENEETEYYLTFADGTTSTSLSLPVNENNGLKSVYLYDLTTNITEAESVEVITPEGAESWIRHTIDITNKRWAVWVSENTAASERSAVIRLASKSNPDASVELTITQEGIPEDIMVFENSEVEAACYAFDNGDGFLTESEIAAVTNLAWMTFPKTTEVSFNEFEYFTSVTTIPDNFFESSKLTAVKFPSSLKYINTSAFWDCTNLTAIELPENVTIQAYAFYGTGLTELTIPSGANIDDGVGAFQSCSGLTTVYVEDGLSSIPESTFANCTSLESISIPGTVTRIDNSCLNACTALKTVTVKATTPPTLTSDVFSDCSSLETIYVPSTALDDYKAATYWSAYSDKMSGTSFE